MPPKNQNKSAPGWMPIMRGASLRKLLYWLVSPALLYGLFLLVYASFFEERLPIGPEIFIPLLLLVPISLYLALDRPE